MCIGGEVEVKKTITKFIIIRQIQFIHSAGSVCTCIWLHS